MHYRTFFKSVLVSKQDNFRYVQSTRFKFFSSWFAKSIHSKFLLSTDDTEHNSYIRNDNPFYIFVLYFYERL